MRFFTQFTRERERLQHIFFPTPTIGSFSLRSRIKDEKNKFIFDRKGKFFLELFYNGVREKKVHLFEMYFF